MGSLVYYNEFLLATDDEALREPGSQRFVELIKTSGDHMLRLRIGPIGEEWPADGYCVQFDKESARRFLDGLESAMGYLGYLED